MIGRLIAALLVLVMGTLAFARENPAALDPDAAYVLVEIQYLENALLKGTKVPGTLTIARYDPVNADVRGGDLSPKTALPGKISPRVVFLDKPIAKTKTGRQYLVKVEPDTWVVEGASGSAFSLGSMMFKVAPGEIVDLGVVKPVVDWVEGEGPKSMMGGMMGAMFFGSLKPKEVRPVRIDWHLRAASDMPVPPVLAGRQIIPAVFVPGATFGNYLGGLINRFGGRATRPDPNAGGSTPGSEVPPAN